MLMVISGEHVDECGLKNSLIISSERVIIYLHLADLHSFRPVYFKHKEVFLVVFMAGNTFMNVA